MKLFYATSILYPSQLANRVQILFTSKAFFKSLRGNFVLAGEEIILKAPYVHNWQRRNGFSRAYSYVRYIREKEMETVYGREDRLIIWMWFFSRLMFPRAQFVFEMHAMPSQGIWSRLLLYVSTKFVVISDGIKNDLVLRGVSPEKILVAPDAVDRELFACANKATSRAELGLPTDATIVTYAGSLTKHHSWKGIDTFLSSVALNPDIIFMVVGGCPEEIEKLRSEYPQENIRFIGFVEHVNVSKYLCASNVLVIPNKKGSLISEKYTSPMKLFEYMASGIPIVASDLPSIREIANESMVWFFEPNSSESLSKTLQDVLNSPEEASMRVKKASKEMESHTWDKRVSAILTFIKQG